MTASRICGPLARGPGGIGVRPDKSPVGSRWYCRHQHAFSRYFRLGTSLNGTTAKGRGLSPPASACRLVEPATGYSLLQLGSGAGGLEILLQLLGLVLRH